MKRHFFTLVLFVMVCLNSNAQTLGEFKPKDQSYNMGKLKNSNKRIYIANFSVNYQIYNEKEKFKQGGSQLGGGMKGDAKSEVSVGLEGLDEKTVQDITDKLYKDYIDRLKAKGMTIVSADEAAKAEAFEDYMKVTGGKVSMAEIPGVMSTAPTGFEYLIKGLDKKGKAKKGGFLGNAASRYPRISKELGDAIVSNVNITVLFVRDQQAFQGNGAKLKVKTDLRIVAQDAVVMTDNDSWIKMKGQNTITGVNSTVDFYHGKMGMAYLGTLGKDISIGGVVDGATVTSYAAGGFDSGTKTMYGTYYSARNGNNSNAKVVKVDAAKYSEGVYQGASKFINFHTDEFLKSF